VGRAIQKEEHRYYTHRRGERWGVYDRHTGTCSLNHKVICVCYTRKLARRVARALNSEYRHSPKKRREFLEAVNRDYAKMLGSGR
jgi:hypothetical protein